MTEVRNPALNYGRGLLSAGQAEVFFVLFLGWDLMLK